MGIVVTFLTKKRKIRPAGPWDIMFIIVRIIITNIKGLSTAEGGRGHVTT